MKSSEIVYIPRRKRINILFSFCIFPWQLWEKMKKKKIKKKKKKKKKLYCKEYCPETAETRMFKEGRTHNFPPRHILSWYKGNERAQAMPYMCVALQVDEKRRKWKDLRGLVRVWKGMLAWGRKIIQHLLFSFKGKNHLKEHLGIKQITFSGKTPSTVCLFLVLFPKESLLKN